MKDMSYYQNPEEINLVFVGDRSSQKTSLVLALEVPEFDFDRPDVYIPSIMDPFVISKMRPPEEGGHYRLALVEINCNESSCDPRLRPLSYVNADVFIVCFSLEDEFATERMFNQWIPEVKKHGPDVPYIIVGTRSESRKDFYKEPISEYISEQIKTRELPGDYTYMEVSAPRRLGLDELLNAACLAGDQHQKVRLTKTRRKKRCQIL